MCHLTYGTICGSFQLMFTGVIKEFGGSVKLAADLGIKSNVVSNWKTRGVARHWRPFIADLANKRGIKLPDDFLDPKRNGP